MQIFSIVLLAVCGVSLTVLLKSVRPELAPVSGAATGVAVLLLVMGELTGLLDAIRAAAAQYGLDSAYIGVLVKIVGIAYVAQLGAQICRDAGEGAAAAKVELGGRVLILTAAMPAAMGVLSIATSLLKEATP